MIIIIVYLFSLCTSTALRVAPPSRQRMCLNAYARLQACVSPFCHVCIILLLQFHLFCPFTHSSSCCARAFSCSDVCFLLSSYETYNTQSYSHPDSLICIPMHCSHACHCPPDSHICPFSFWCLFNTLSSSLPHRLTLNACSPRDNATRAEEAVLNIGRYTRQQNMISATSGMRACVFPCSVFAYWSI